jgi:acetoin utilization protein AcuB
VTVPAGDPASAIRMRWSEFERLAEARPGDFAVPPSMVAAGGVVRPRRRHGRAASTPRQTQEESPMTARDLMTSNPATVTPRTTIAEAWDLMRELDVRHLPVVEGEALVGMLSDRDLGNLDVTRLLTEAGADTLRRQLSRPVVQLMSTDVVAAEPETEVSELVTLLLEHKVGAIPVVTPDTRQIVGIVSYIDVLRVLQEVLEPE